MACCGIGQLTPPCEVAKGMEGADKGKALPDRYKGRSFSKTDCNKRIRVIASSSLSPSLAHRIVTAQWKGPKGLTPTNQTF